MIQLLITAGALVLLFIILEVAIRVIIDLPAKTEFYSSIGRDKISFYQEEFGVKQNTGPDWVHLGWVADPLGERYSVFMEDASGEKLIGETRFGSFLVESLRPESSYRFRVASTDGKFNHHTECYTGKSPGAPVMVPYIASGWKPLFRPSRTGNYINDHTVFQAADGTWHVIGITAFGEGDYSKEVYFAHGTSPDFPPAGGTTMTELEPVADFGRLAWAPHVLKEDKYYMWYSPHRAYLATSTDGYSWREEDRYSFLPYHPQFRDPMVLKVSENQWLMYATARDGYYSSVDVYQSFDLLHWQYIRPALAMSFGAERAGAQASTESPFVFERDGIFYLSITYNNGSFFWNPLLLTIKIWPCSESYNDTLIFHSRNPYSFGTYRGRNKPSSLVSLLRAHAPEYIYHNAAWYITTAGWPWVASLTGGEVSVAELGWNIKK